MKSLKSFLLLISGISALIFIYRLIKGGNVPVLDSFPKAAEKAVAEKEVSQIKDEIKKLEQKNYSDEEILKKFN